MKKLLLVLAALSFSFAANAENNLEIQMTPNIGGTMALGGTQGGFQINDKDTGDNSPWSLAGEAYKSFSDNLQIGGLLSFGDADTGGREMSYSIGLMARYNLDSDLRDSMFGGVGLAYSELGFENVDSTRIALLLQAGKRFALSDTITWTPNVTINLGVAGDLDSGTVIALNFLSFSGFMGM